VKKYVDVYDFSSQISLGSGICHYHNLPSFKITSQPCKPCQHNTYTITYTNTYTSTTNTQYSQHPRPTNQTGSSITQPNPPLKITIQPCKPCEPKALPAQHKHTPMQPTPNTVNISGLSTTIKSKSNTKNQKRQLYTYNRRMIPQTQRR